MESNGSRFEKNCQFLVDIRGEALRRSSKAHVLRVCAGPLKVVGVQVKIADLQEISVLPDAWCERASVVSHSH
jgi:hypothetical protein